MRYFALVAALLVAAIIPQHLAGARALRPIPRHHFRPVCTSGRIRCNAELVTDATPATGSVVPAAYGPPQFHTAYRLPCTPGGLIQSVCHEPSTFGGQTIGIVDAGGDATVESDLATFDNTFGLPACTQANGCLRVVGQTGSTTLPPSAGWEIEIALDVETAHDICQTCKILLVEANDAGVGSLSVSVDTAARLGATEISNSYGGTDGNFSAASFDHPGVAITASSGDSGFAAGSSWPAALPTVIGVGGTTLQLATSNTYVSESVWNLGGSGCSALNTANAFQKAAPGYAATGCGSERADVDVAADADPNTGATIYQGGWKQVGGTSLASPLIAGVIALAGGVAGVSNPESVPYSDFTSTTSHDITTGRNGSCATSICFAATGYDGPTGLGTPNGVGGFQHHAPAPTPTSTTVPTPKPTSTTIPTPRPTATPSPPTPSPTAAPPPPVLPTPTATPPPHKKHRHFPKKRWNSYRRAHHEAPISFKINGKITRIAWAWWRDRGIAAHCGAVVGQHGQITVLGTVVNAQRFVHGWLIDEPQTKRDRLHVQCQGLHS